MKNFARFCGGLGIIFVIFGAVASLVFQGQYRAISYVQIGLGVFGCAFFLFHFIGDTMSTISRKSDAIFGILGGLLVFFLIIGVNVIAHSRWGEKTYDTTVNKIHSLSSDSVELLKGLKTPISIAAFFAEGVRERQLLKNLIDKYRLQTGQIKFEVYDPDKFPTMMEQYGSAADEIVVRNETTKKSVKLTGISEQDVTTAIKRVMSDKTKSLYFLQGHGEGDLEDDKTSGGLYIAKVLLENEGFKVMPLHLATTPEIPKDAEMIVAWGAQRPLSSSEANLLSNFLERGGSLVIGQDPLLTAKKDKLLSNGFEPLLDKYGLEFGEAVMLEHQIQLLRGRVINAKLAVSDYDSSHPITSKLNAQSVSEFFMIQPVLQKSDYKGAATRTSLIKTSKNSWAERDIASLFISQQPSSQGDRPGPVSIAQISEWSVTDKVKDRIAEKGRLVVYGDSDFAANQLIQSGYNRDIFLNTIGFLGGDETAVSIRPKNWTTSTLEIGPAEKRLIYYASIFVIPQLIMMLGMSIWLIRRRRV